MRTGQVKFASAIERRSAPTRRRHPVGRNHAAVLPQQGQRSLELVRPRLRLPPGTSYEILEIPCITVIDLLSEFGDALPGLMRRPSESICITKGYKNIQIGVR